MRGLVLHSPSVDAASSSAPSLQKAGSSRASGTAGLEPVTAVCLTSFVEHTAVIQLTAVILQTRFVRKVPDVQEFDSHMQCSSVMSAGNLTYRTRTPGCYCRRLGRVSLLSGSRSGKGSQGVFRTDDGSCTLTRSTKQTAARAEAARAR